ncbi:MAG: stage III sporulation protein AE [Lachnospiraceae bacterium]|nr:stage III sporulation protein AE [Lachnospiraceae bacterium]
MDISLEDIWQDYGLDELQEGLNTLFPEHTFSLWELLEKVLAGDIMGALGCLYEGSIGNIISQMAGLRDILLWLLLLGIASSILTHFVEIFDRHQIADLGYYFMYLLFVVILFQCFKQTSETALETMESIVLFIQMMVPTYLLAVGVATGVATVGAYSQLLLLLVYGVERLLSGWVHSLISVYVVLSVVNGIWIEEKLSLLVELVGKLISLILKAALGIVTGISIFQTLITPVIDSARSSILQKVISVVPGIGNMAEGVVELVVGSAVVIKNSIGVLLLILLIWMCIVPLLKIYIIAWLLKLAAALLGMISDKRLVSCTNQMGEGCMLMFRTAGTSMLLFVIVLSVLATATNRGF